MTGCTIPDAIEGVDSGDDPRPRPSRSGAHRVRLAGTAAALVLAIVAACAPAPRPEPQPGRGAPARSRIRVGLAVRVPEVVLETQGRWQLRSGPEIRVLPAGAQLRFQLQNSQLLGTSGADVVGSDPQQLSLEPLEAEATARLTDTPYRGLLRLRLDAGALTLVDELEIEEYLRGVVPWEIGCAPDVQAAVEAQAIAARTYACSRLGQFENQGFDVWADVRDQVFRGAARFDGVADRAIAATRGLVLDQDGQLVQAYYCSTCGGFTSWIEHVWTKPAQPYLRGHRDAPADGVSFCAASPHFRWSEAWSGADLERTIQETLPAVLQLPAGTPVGALLDLSAGERDDSGRVLDLEVRTASATFHVRGDGIRRVLRPRDRPLLRSLMFKLAIERREGAIVRVVARGGGNGHGVGLCQMGALGMARQGFDRGAILGHYYEGATLRRAY